MNQIQISYLKNQEEIPSWLSFELLNEFIFENLKPFNDTLEEIHKGLSYAFGIERKPGGFVLLAHENKNLLGVLVMLKTGMGGFIPENVLLYIGVKPESRGMGIGRQLIEQAKEHCSGAIKLHVEHDNPAIHLYKREGFTSKYIEMRYNNGSSR